MNLKICKFILFFSIALVFTSTGCKTIFVKDPAKEAFKIEKKSNSEALKAYADAQKTHFQNQDKKTQQRMKKNERAAKKRNKKYRKKKKSAWDCN